MAATKAKLRMPPPAAVLAEQQTAAEHLIKLEAWTEMPSNSPPQAEQAKPATKPLPKAKPAPEPVPEPPKQPWQSVSPDAAHPYYIIISEALFQKLDFCWKRTSQASMKALVLKTLTERADAILKELGEKP